MLKRLLTFLFFCICLMKSALAQDIYFCSHYSDKGEPTDATHTWNLDEKGRYIYILFSNHGKRIKSKNLVMNVMKQTNSGYKNYEKRAMKLQNSKTWAVLDYQFIEAGNYEVIVRDDKGKDLAAGYLTVILQSPGESGKDPLPDKNQTAQKDPGRSYYNARTIFCKSVNNGIAMDTGSVFKAGEVNIEVINDNPLASDSMIVDVFKKGFETEKYPIYVVSKNFRIDGTQNKAFFSLTLEQTGEYKVVCYNKQSQTISVGFVLIR